MRLLNKTNIPFLKYKFVAAGISMLLLLAGFGYYAFGPGLNLGIDFKGGTQVQVRFHDPQDLEQIRVLLGDLGVGDAVVQRIDEPELNIVMIGMQNPDEAEGDYTSPILATLENTYNSENFAELIDVQELIAELSLKPRDRKYEAPTHTKFDLNRQGAQELSDLLSDADPDGVGDDPEVRKAAYVVQAEALFAWRSDIGMIQSIDQVQGATSVSDGVKGWVAENAVAGNFLLMSADNVGPSVGADLKKKASYAVWGALIGMLLYITFRFQLPYGIGALAALGHDVFITLTALAITQREINLPTIAALLTLVGYSVNDTVVVFDRVRENIKIKRSNDLEALMDLSINQMLSRTMITSGTTLFVVLTLLLFGGAVINTFAFVLLIGVVAGTYSSIYVAAPVALAVTNWRKARVAARSKR